MSDANELTLGDVLIAFEGLSRLRWLKTDQGPWSVIGVWPHPDRRKALLQQLRYGKRLLIVVDSDPPVTTLLAEESRNLPAELVIRSDAEEEIVDVEVPALNWLPDDLRERGSQFIRSARTRASRASGLIPPLLLDEASGESVRFAYRTTSRLPINETLLRRVVLEAFRSGPENAAETASPC
ncbi:hypothetical protein [Streptomyces sp. NPDC020362]|uniref:hypothetical protein n=1 Tax=unclassified Streptomyces TaxID=2593676 RepID=UPI000AD3B496